MAPEEQLAWEKEAGRKAGAAAIAAGALLLLASFYPAIVGARLDSVREFERFLRFDRDPSLVFVPSILQALGYAAAAVALAYLARVTRARRDQQAGVTKIFAVAGPAANAVAALLLAYAVYHVSTQLADLNLPRDVTAPGEGAAGLAGTQVRGEDAIRDLQTDSGLYTAAAVIDFAANLTLGFALVLVGLNAMRAGLLSRFIGIIGIIAGVLTVVFRGAGIIESFWLVAIGFLFLDRLPNGRGPAWSAVEAIPWPSAMERKAAQLEERNEAEGAYDEDETRTTRTSREDDGEPGRGRAALRKRRHAAPGLEEAQEEAPALGGARQVHDRRDLVAQAGQLERLLDEPVRADAERVVAVRATGPRGQDDDRHVLGRGQLAQLAGQVVAVHAGHHDVDDRQVGRILGRDLEQRLEPVGREQRLMARPLQVRRDQVADVVGIVDDEHAQLPDLIAHTSLIVRRARSL